MRASIVSWSLGWSTAIGWAAAPAYAGDWYVDATANCASADGSSVAPWCTIGEALAVAANGDVIHVAPGTYAENLVVAADVTLIGTGGSAATVIDGGGNGTVVEIASLASVVLDGLTVRNGLAPHGSGIHVLSGATLDLRRSTVRDNLLDAATLQPDHGGGICVEQATLLADASQIWSNDALYDGAGIWADGATIVVTDCSIDANFAGATNDAVAPSAEGGGIYCQASDLTLARSTLSRNVAGQLGYVGEWGLGGSVWADGCDVTVDDCEIRGSVASVYAGGIGTVDCTVAIADSRFEGNRSSKGGGLGLSNSSSATIDDCTFTHNEVGDFSFWGDGAGGGASLSGPAVVTDCDFTDNKGLIGVGVYVLGTVTLDHCRITGNVADHYDASGGGIYNLGTLTVADCEVRGNVLKGGGNVRGGGIYASGTATLVNSTVAGNLCRRQPSGAVFGSGGGVYVRAGKLFDLGHSIVAGNSALTNDVDGVVNSLGYDCVGDTNGATFNGDPTGNQLDVDPLFADLANGDVSLSSASPCIDAGDPALAPAGRDVAGTPRLLDGDLDRSLVVDLGAREFDHVRLDVSGAATPGGTLTLDTSGTPGLAVLLFVGVGEAELAFPHFGALFVDLGLAWLALPWSTIPSSIDVAIDPSFPAPFTIHAQELAFDAALRAGNFGNPVTIALE